MWLRHALAIAVASAALTVAGCGAGDERRLEPGGTAKSGTTYRGEIDASPASISLKVDGTQLTGAVCQGSRTSVPLDPTIVKNDSAELVHNGRPIGTVSITTDLAVGTIELAGTRHKFRAPVATDMADLCGKP
jgi:hypothetical protein